MNAILNPTNDSAFLHEKNQQAERAKVATKLAALGSSNLSNITEVQGEEAEAEGQSYSNVYPFLGWFLWAGVRRLDIHVVLLASDRLQPLLRQRRRRGTKKTIRATLKLLAI